MKGLRSDAEITIVGSTNKEAGSMTAMPDGTMCFQLSVGVGGSQSKGTKANWYVIKVYGIDAEMLNKLEITPSAGVKACGFPRFKAYISKDKKEAREDISLYPRWIEINNDDGQGWRKIYIKADDVSNG